MWGFFKDFYLVCRKYTFSWIIDENNCYQARLMVKKYFLLLLSITIEKGHEKVIYSWHIASTEALTSITVHNSFYSTVLCKVIKHKSLGEQFLWNRNWDLGWFWASWQYWKKMGRLWADFSGRFFSCSHGWKNIFSLKILHVASALKSCRKWR